MTHLLRRLSVAFVSTLVVAAVGCNSEAPIDDDETRSIASAGVTCNATTCTGVTTCTRSALITKASALAKWVANKRCGAGYDGQPGCVKPWVQYPCSNDANGQKAADVAREWGYLGIAMYWQNNCTWGPVSDISRCGATVYQRRLTCGAQNYPLSYTSNFNHAVKQCWPGAENFFVISANQSQGKVIIEIDPEAVVLQETLSDDPSNASNNGALSKGKVTGTFTRMWRWPSNDVAADGDGYPAGGTPCSSNANINTSGESSKQQIIENGDQRACL